MLNSLAGDVTDWGPGFVRIQTGGMEWELEAGTATVQFCAAATGPVRILVYLQHRDDIMKLYGFSSEQERALFLELIKIDGIGPKQAVKILSGIGPSEFYAALENEDIHALVRIPGLGTKTAGKIILALKGKIRFGAEPGAPGSPGVEQEFVEALTEMGFDKQKARTAVRGILAEMGSDTPHPSVLEQEVLRRAIVMLS
jgi:holliday junction DNA helicase RuvA